jgi:peptidoglycan-associated lipoprotein
MKISKKILPFILILFVLLVSGCSKNLLGRGTVDSDSSNLGLTSDLEEIDEKSGAGATSPSSGQKTGAGEQGVPGNGSAGSFSADAFSGDRDALGQGSPDEGVGARAKAGADAGSGAGASADAGAGDFPLSSSRGFGSAEPGMPGNGSAGSFGADAFSGDAFSSDRGRDFGSAEPGMPGNGSSGSFNADAFSGDRGAFGQGSPGEGVDAGAKAFAGSGLLGDDSLGVEGFPFDSRQDFGSAEPGMPDNGSSGSFSADAFSGERGQGGDGILNETVAEVKTPEPFLTEKGEEMSVPLLRDEEFRRVLPYQDTVRLRDIHFAFDKYDLDEKSRAILKENVAYLKTHPASRIEIQGHCDERGSNSYNISLGERRAQSTKNYLTSLGVDGSRIHTISYGEERPFCFSSNEECWYQNRRAHFLVSKPLGNLATPAP